MIPSWARVGAKVVCVDNSYHGQGVNRGLRPDMRSICTISEIIPCIWGGGYAFVVPEFPNFCPVSGYDLGWKSSRFRPLITQQDDISLFTLRFLFD